MKWIGSGRKAIALVLCALLLFPLLVSCKEEEDLTVHTLDLESSFLTNVNDGDNHKLYLKAEVSVEVISAAHFEKLQTRIHEVQDIILGELRLLTRDDVYDPIIQETLKPILVEKLRDGLGLDISNVYFRSFVAQQNK
ncbi:flagellar basal body-associated FliL family protein [Oscillospiraceae bacterium OttesenSCG-928-G22]|nr:flagellar basal body-associated FliL family protein [Oscillospiraceae bacterium OttesenSCG-928-G22]